MPTFAKLTAALGFGIVMYLVSTVTMPEFAPSAPPKWFMQINVIVGAVLGWNIIGPRMGRGVVASISAGLTCVVVVVLAALLVHGFIEMIDRALNLRYDGALEALVGSFDIAIEMGARLFSETSVLTLIIGSMVASLAAEFISRFFD